MYNWNTNKKKEKKRGNYIKKKFEDIAENGIHIKIPEESEVDSYHDWLQWFYC